MQQNVSEKSAQQICRRCLEEIPISFPSIYLLQKPEDDIKLSGHTLAKSYLECYYFCMARDYKKNLPMESLNYYGHICLRCKNFLLKVTKFIVSSGINEELLLSKLDKKSSVEMNIPPVEFETNNKLNDNNSVTCSEEELEMIEEYLESTENESSTKAEYGKRLELQLGVASKTNDMLKENSKSQKDENYGLETFEEIILEAASNNNCTLEETTPLDSEKPNVSKWKIEQYLCFNCELCTKVFNLESQLYEHYDNEHDQKCFCFPCDICKGRYASFKALRYHRHRDHKNYKYVDCKICGKAVVGKFYKRHMEQHVFKCDKCDKSYNSKLELHKHLRMTHELVREKRYNCLECNRHFFSSKNLKLHSNTHKNNTNSTEGYIFSCVVCSKSFSRPVHLKQHLDSHRRDILKCPHCHKEFTRLSDIETHLRLHVKNIDNKCKICNQEFGCVDPLSCHKQHKSALYQCPYCDKIFDSSFDLRQHSYHHSGWPYTCNLCSEGFLSVYIIRRHLKAVHWEKFANRYSDELADTLYKRHKIKEIFPRVRNIL